MVQARRSSFMGVLARPLLGLACIISASLAHAQGSAYPTRPITMIVPFAAGGVPDMFARLLGEHVSRALGQPIVVDNRGGAGGNVGLRAAAAAPADGHTLVMCAFGCATNPHLYRPAPFDPLRDFSPVMLVGTLPNVLVVNAAKVPARSVAELVEGLKRNPESITFASSGMGSSGHLANELLKRLTGVKILHVPYRGQGPASNDLIAGHVLAFFDGIPSSLQHIQAGTLRALATTGPRRASALPDVPTMEEAGLAGFQVVPWMAVMGPANLPPDVVGRLNRAFNEALADPQVRRRFSELSVEPGGGTPEQLTAFIRVELARWKDIIEQNNIRAE